MKLRNKGTGEIVTPACFDFCLLRGVNNRGIEIKGKWYNSLTEISKDWEDYKEPEGSALDLMILTLTNFIENEPDEDKVDLEDCKQMLEKLKAWKRLKDKGFRFNKWFTRALGGLQINVKFDEYCGISQEDKKDLDLLFGGEE